MENNRGKTPPDYSVDDILAEAKGRLSSKAYQELSGDDEPKEPRVRPQPVQTPPEQPAIPQPGPEIPAPVQPPPQEIPAQPASPGQNGEIRFRSGGAEPPDPPREEPPEPRGLRGFFARRRKQKEQCEFDDEEDIYYGLQLKPVDEYKKGYDEPAEKGPTSTFRYLFDETPEEGVEEEISARFQPFAPPETGPVHLVEQERPAQPAKPDRRENRQKPLKQAEPEKKSTTQEFRLPEPPGAFHLRNEPIPFPKETKSGYADLEEAARLLKQARDKEQAAQSPERKPDRPVRQVLHAQAPVSKEITKEMDVVLPAAPPLKAPEQGVAPTAYEPEQSANSAVPTHDAQRSTAETASDAEKKPSAGEDVPKTDGAAKSTLPAQEPEAKVKSAAFAQEPEQSGTEEERRARAALEQVQAQNARLRAERKKKEQIRELVRASRKYLPDLLPVHVLEFDRLEAALTRAEQAYLPEEMEPEPKQDEVLQQRRSRRKKWQAGSLGVHTFHFLGEAEEENEPGDEPSPEPEPENLDDYTAPEDAPSIQHELGAEHRALALRVSVTGILFLVLAFWGFVSERSAMLPVFLRADVLPLAYLIANLCLLSISIVFCRKTVIGGIRALFSRQANSDSGVAVAAAAAWIQGVALLFQTQAVESAQLHLYAVLAALALFLNSAGKLSMVRRIRANFRFLTSPEPKQGIELFDDYNTALQLAKGCVAGEPVIAYQRQTGFFRNFLRNSYEPDPSEQASQSMAPLLFLGSLALCAVSLVLTRSAGAAITALTAAACVSAPVTNMLCINMPVSRLCALARRCGTMLVGNPSVDYFCNTNALMLDAKELFPKGTVILNGIKTFRGQRIDEAIMDATAVMCTLGGPLSDLFEQIVQHRRDILPKAENITYEDERGVTGWVGGRRTLVGTRRLLEQHGLTPPSRDYENKYLLGGKKVVYLASQGELVAMFVISYHSDKRRALELRRMEENGVSLILRTTDPNMTPEFVAECFGLDPHSVRILPETLGAVYQKQIETPRERGDALFVTKGRPASMMRMLTACVREKSNITMATLLQTVGVILGFVLVAFLVFYSGLGQLSTLSLLLYQLFWIAAVLIIPRLRKP